MRIIRPALTLAIVLLVAPPRAHADQIRVFTSGAFTEAFLLLVADFQDRTQHKISTSFGASMGGAPDSIPSRLQRGEPADVVIMARPALDELIKQGKVVAGSAVDLVRSEIGMAVRAGAARPDISSVEALRRALLAAKSIAYSASASGTYLSSDLFPRLGIWDQIKGKSLRIESERVGAVVARGDAEIGFQQVSELLPIPGIDYVGPLPAEVQQVTIFSAGMVVGSKAPAAAKQLVEFLASSSAATLIRKTGLEPIAAAVTR